MSRTLSGSSNEDSTGEYGAAGMEDEPAEASAGAGIDEAEEVTTYVTIREKYTRVSFSIHCSGGQPVEQVLGAASQE